MICKAALYYTVRVSLLVVHTVHSVDSNKFGLKWVMDSYGHTGPKRDNSKSLKTLEKLGHKDLRLDEYESKFSR